ncbi:MAG: hypothetical protein ACK559_41455, partial [bacterium]
MARMAARSDALVTTAGSGSASSSVAQPGTIAGGQSPHATSRIPRSEPQPVPLPSRSHGQVAPHAPQP